jgi:hypothetical protein
LHFKRMLQRWYYDVNQGRGIMSLVCDLSG